MVPLSFFAHTTKQAQGNCGLDVGMAINTWCNGADDLFNDPWIARERTNVSLIFFSQPEACQLIVGFDDMICFEDGGEDWETVLVVQSSVVIVPVNSSNFD